MPKPEAFGSRVYSRSIQYYIVLRQRKADGLGDLVVLLRNLLQSFVDWCIKILLSTLGTYPGRDMIHIDGLAVDMEPGPDLPLFYCAFTTLTASTVYNGQNVAYLRGHHNRPARFICLQRLSRNSWPRLPSGYGRARLPWNLVKGITLMLSSTTQSGQWRL
jgi:hypothetical protein